MEKDQPTFWHRRPPFCVGRRCLRTGPPSPKERVRSLDWVFQSDNWACFITDVLRDSQTVFCHQGCIPGCWKRLRGDPGSLVLLVLEKIVYKTSRLIRKKLVNFFFKLTEFWIKHERLTPYFSNYSGSHIIHKRIKRAPPAHQNNDQFLGGRFGPLWTCRGRWILGSGESCNIGHRAVSS